MDNPKKTGYTRYKIQTKKTETQHNTISIKFLLLTAFRKSCTFRFVVRKWYFKGIEIFKFMTSIISCKVSKSPFKFRFSYQQYGCIYCAIVVYGYKGSNLFRNTLVTQSYSLSHRYNWYWYCPFCTIVLWKHIYPILCTRVFNTFIVKRWESQII